MAAVQTYTTSRGVCPFGQEGLCADFCDKVQICAELEKGECEIAGTNPIDDTRRYLYNYHIRIQNCTSNELYLNAPELDFLGRIRSVQYNPITDVRVIDSDLANAPLPPSFPQGVFKLLDITSSCGTANSLYNGGINFNPSSQKNKLLSGSNNLIPPGECCISLTFAVDVPRDGVTGQFPVIFVEPAALCVSGRQFSGNSCCHFDRSLLVPGDCELQSLRGTIPLLAPF